MEAFGINVGDTETMSSQTKLSNQRDRIDELLGLLEETTTRYGWHHPDTKEVIRRIKEHKLCESPARGPEINVLQYGGFVAGFTNPH